MVHVIFTPNLERHVEHFPRAARADGRTVREVLDQVFAAHPGVREYVLDDQGAVRRHMVVFVNGRQIADRGRLSDPVPEGAEVCVMQALSGG